MTDHRRLARAILGGVLTAISACGGGVVADESRPTIASGSLAELIIIGRPLAERPDRIEGLDRIYDVEVQEVLWEDEPYLIDGVRLNWTSPRPGDAVVVVVPDEIAWKGEQPMQLFLSATVGGPAALEEAVGGEYWWLRLSVDAATGQVAPDWGVDPAEVDAVLLESEPGSPDDRVNALTEFVIQYVEQREQPGGFKGIPGERYTQWLEFIEGDGDEVDTVAEWLSRDPDTRQVPSVLDNTAVDLATELGLTWRRASFLIEWDEDVAGQWVGIYFDSIGVVGPWYLEPADAAVIVDGIVPLDRLGTVFVWPFEVVRAAPDSDALVTERVAMGQVDPLTGGDPALWISIRLSNGVGSVIEPLSRAEFRELSDSIDFAREAATPGG